PLCTPPSNASALLNTTGTTCSGHVHSPSAQPWLSTPTLSTTWKEKAPPPALNGWVSSVEQRRVSSAERHRCVCDYVQRSESAALNHRLAEQLPALPAFP